MKIKTSAEHNGLKHRIIEAIGTGINKDALVKKVVATDPAFPGLWMSDDVNETLVAINQLLADELIFESDGLIKVSEYQPCQPDLMESNDPLAQQYLQATDTMREITASNKMDAAQNDDLLYKEVPEGAQRFESVVSAIVNPDIDDTPHEFTLEEILVHLESISADDLAREIGGWIEANVEKFIDNKETVFRMYLNVNSGMGMPTSSLFQRLYLSVPDVNEKAGITVEAIESAYDALDNKLVEAKNKLDADEEFQAKLFKRMAFYYEMTGFVVHSGGIVQAATTPMVGRISINELAFDPVTLSSIVAQGIGKNEGGTIREGKEKVIVRQEELSAGFGIEVEISMRPRGSAPPAMY